MSWTRPFGQGDDAGGRLFQRPRQLPEMFCRSSSGDISVTETSQQAGAILAIAPAFYQVEEGTRDSGSATAFVTALTSREFGLAFEESIVWLRGAQSHSNGGREAGGRWMCCDGDRRHDEHHDIQNLPRRRRRGRRRVMRQAGNNGQRQRRTVTTVRRTAFRSSPQGSRSVLPVAAVRVRQRNGIRNRSGQFSAELRSSQVALGQPGWWLVEQTEQRRLVRAPANDAGARARRRMNPSDGGCRCW